MKTPREILLKCHEAAEPKLAALAERVIAGLDRGEKVSPALSERIRSVFVWPRLGWSALAAAWIVILALNVASHESAPGPLVAQSPRPETIEILREQRQLYAELIGSGIAADAEPSRSPPRPHSARRTDFAFA